MSKTITTLIAIAALTFTSTAALAGSIKCEVVNTKDNVVTFDCGKKADKLQVGQQVKVRTAKKAIEGC